VSIFVCITELYVHWVSFLGVKRPGAWRWPPTTIWRRG